ncbi:MAG: Alpha/Beta hydrolase protein, partial [Podila humilis]
PNILLVHGALADGSSWSDVIPLLMAAGYNVTAVQQPLTSLPDDIAKTKVALATLPGPVVIVGHSFGGVVITNAAYNAPNVAGLVYVAAFGPDKGESVTDLGKNFTAVPSGKLFVPDSAGRLILSQPNFVKYFAPDVNKVKAKVMAAVQGPCDAPRFTWQSGPPAWKQKPSWHIVSGNDQIINPDVEEFCAKRMGAKKIVKVAGASHAVMVSHPKVVAALIIEAAK